jgi:hypothetical protein
MINNFFFFKNPAVYQKMWKNNLDLDRPQMTMWRMRSAYWIPKASNTLLKYVLFVALHQQQCLQERPSKLRHA